jgi:hypothetical protein
MAVIEKSRHCSAMAGKDWNLNITENGDGSITITRDRMQIVLLWEVVQELKKLNALLHCTNFQNVPLTLRGMRRELATLRKIAEGKK